MTEAHQEAHVTGLNNVSTKKQTPGLISTLFSG